MALRDRWSYYATTGAVQNSVNQVGTMAANDHIRRVRVIGNVTFNIKPTAVIGDDGIFLGVVAAFPAVAPAVPTYANAGVWSSGWWGRPPIRAVEAIYWAGVTNQPAYRWHFDFEFPYEPDNGGSAGALYIGTAQMYVDANHVAPNTSYTVDVWGYQS